MKESVTCVIPAAGLASRIGGVPKFLLPTPEDVSLIKYHVDLAQQYANQVVVVTRPEWAHVMHKELQDSESHIIVKETKTMTETVVTALRLVSSDVCVVQMADTYLGSGKILKDISEVSAEKQTDCLAIWRTRESQMGKLGQVQLKAVAKDLNSVIKMVDKDPTFHTGLHWGAIALHKPNYAKWDLTLSHIGLVLERKLNVEKEEILALITDEQYFDLGTKSELSEFLNIQKNL